MTRENDDSYEPADALIDVGALSERELDRAIDAFIASLTLTLTQEEAAVEAIATALGDNVKAVYLYGSAVDGGLRPHSDLDLLVVVGRDLTQDERWSLTTLLTPISSLHRRPPDWLPLEVTVATTADLSPWRHPARVQIQLGEWMRNELDAGTVPGPHDSADLTVLVSQVLRSGKALVGPEPAVLIAEPATDDLHRAMVDSLPALLADLKTDTANVLLTLARMWFTAETGKFAPKDVCADWAITRSGSEDATPLERARDVYLGEHDDEWDDLRAETMVLAAQLEAEIRQGARP